MPAPTGSYVAASGSMFRFYDQAYDVELVNSVGSIVFAGSGSVRPSYFEMTIEGRKEIITNKYQVDRLNMRKYLFPIPGNPYEYSYNYVSASLDLFREFEGRYNAFLNMFESIKGYTEVTSSSTPKNFFPVVPPVS